MVVPVEIATKIDRLGGPFCAYYSSGSSSALVKKISRIDGVLSFVSST
jgi:hypothetical protein